MKISLSRLISFFKKSKKTILLILSVAIITLAVSTGISILLTRMNTFRLPTVGTIRIIGAEAMGGDINITEDGKQFIDWGTVYPGKPVNRSFYIKSKSNVPIKIALIDIAKANITFQNSRGEEISEHPPIMKPINLTLDLNNTEIKPNEKVYVTLTLTISSDPEFLHFLIEKDAQNFSFEIVIKTFEA